MCARIQVNSNKQIRLMSFMMLQMYKMAFQA